VTKECTISATDMRNPQHKHKSVTPITIKRAGEYLGLTTWQVHELTVSGELSSAVLNGRRLVALEDVRKLRPAARIANSGGRAIRVMREAQELSQQDLARLARVSRGYLSRVERGAVWASEDWLWRVSTALGRNLAGAR
jgi:DNA-binding transcriptional regulator YiaG